MGLVSGWDGQFTCPSCDQLFFNDSSVVYDDAYGDSICWQCAESLEQERKDEAGCCNG